MDDFVTAARAETMLKDFNRLRKAVRGDNWPDAQAALDKCERWFDQISPNTIARIEALTARNERLEAIVTYIAGTNSDHIRCALLGNPTVIDGVVAEARAALSPDTKEG